MLKSQMTRLAIDYVMYVNQMNRPLNTWLVQVRKSSDSLEPIANDELLGSKVRTADIPSLASAYQKRITTPAYAKMKVCKLCADMLLLFESRSHILHTGKAILTSNLLFP
jgi:hypothetical protein